MSGEVRSRDVFSSSLLIIGVLDISMCIVAAAVFAALLGIVDVRVLIALLIIRAVPVTVVLLRALAPIRAWQQRPRFDERLLVAADRAFADLFRRFGPTYVGTWIASGTAAVLLGYAGLPEPLPIGPLELMCGVIVLVAMMFGVTAGLRPMLDSMFPNVRAELGGALLERRMGGRRASDPIGSRLMLINMGIFAACLLALLAALALERGKSERNDLQAKQSARATQVAAQLREGRIDEAELDPGVELLDTHELPESLGVTPGRAFVPGEVVAVVDVRSETTMAAAPIGGGRWVLAQAEIEQDLGHTALQVLAFVVITLLPVWLINAALSRTLTIPLQRLTDATRRMAEEGDIRALARVMPLHNDELGALASNFNRMLDVLEQLAATAATVAEGDLQVELEGRGDLQDAFRGMLARLHEMVVQVRSDSLELAKAAVEIQATTREQQTAVLQQSQRVMLVSDAVATLARSAEEISGAAGDVLDNAEQTLTTTNAMIDEIIELNDQANNVGELLELIREIADRSDLLALNGSLEATRAGEAGRGFALVAAEMRRLAERVTGTVATVRERIASISAAGASTVTATENNRKLANDTAAAARRISTITQHQSTDTEQVSNEVLAVAEVMTATVASTTQTHAAAVGLSQQAAELERLTGKFKLRALGEPRGGVDQGSLR